MTESPTPLYSCARCGLRIDPTVQRDVDLDQVTPTASCRRCGHEYSMCKDLVHAHLASIWVPAYVPYDVAEHLGADNPRAEERATVKAYMIGVRSPSRIRSAMAAMVNVMTCVRDAFMHADSLQSRYTLSQALDRSRSNWPKFTRAEQSVASLEWSRRVRAGVAALPKPGPAVCCQSEED